MSIRQSAAKLMGALYMLCSDKVKPEWIMQIPVLSTVHLKHSTMQRLNALSVLGIVSAQYDTGAFIFVPEEVQYSLPSDLQWILQWTKDKGFAWVRLDADGEERDDLARYDWE